MKETLPSDATSFAACVRSIAPSAASARVPVRIRPAVVWVMVLAAPSPLAVSDRPARAEVMIGASIAIELPASETVSDAPSDSTGAATVILPVVLKLTSDRE